ncbi:uncharacterized protein METZ01_LOCUS226547 [marine metagenome]|uniref:Uncharacterized protein n=1 Tax=marine metagenome TaxID=408172 RepID=A0A382GGG2_9ZZZZ
MKTYRKFFIVILLFMGTSCHIIGPGADTGPVIDGSRNVDASLFVPGGSAQAVPIFIRHFHYYSRPAAWTIVSSGDSGARTHFEEAGVYAFTSVGGNAEPFITRLARIPGVSMNGASPPRIHLSISPPGPLGTGNSSAIVYVEDGPIYGGLDVGVDLTGLEPALDMPLRLLVNARVRAAALSDNGETVAYVDDQGRLFFKRGDDEPDKIIDIKSTLGSTDIRRMLWLYGGGLLVVLNRGFGLEVRRLEQNFETRLVRTFQDPETIREHGADGLPFIDQITENFSAEDWTVPEPSRYSE